MSKLYGTLMADRGQSTRTSSRVIEAAIQSYDGSVVTHMHFQNGEVWVQIGIAKGSSTSIDKIIFHGTLKELMKSTMVRGVWGNE